MDLAWLNKRMAEVSESDELQQFEEKLKELPGHVDAIIASVRKIATELRPQILDDLGLEAAVEWQVREFEKRTGIKCQFTCSLKHIDLGADRSEEHTSELQSHSDLVCRLLLEEKKE